MLKYNNLLSFYSVNTNHIIKILKNKIFKSDQVTYKKLQC